MKRLFVLSVVFVALLLAGCSDGSDSGGNGGGGDNAAPGTFRVSVDPSNGYLVLQGLDVAAGYNNWETISSGGNWVARFQETIGILPAVIDFRINGASAVSGDVLIADGEMVSATLRFVNLDTDQVIMPKLDRNDPGIGDWVYLDASSNKKIGFVFKAETVDDPASLSKLPGGWFYRQDWLRLQGEDLEMKTYLATAGEPLDNISSVTVIAKDEKVGDFSQDIFLDGSESWSRVIVSMAEGVSLITLRVNMEGGGENWIKLYLLWNELDPFVIKLIRSNGDEVKWICVIREGDTIRYPEEADKGAILAVANGKEDLYIDVLFP